jgi:hypothetical protein
MWCNHCKKWELMEDDIYCSWCGNSIFQVKLLSDPIRLYVGSTNSNNNNITTGIVRNIGDNPLTLTCESKPAWLSLSLPNTALQPEGQLEAILGVDTPKLGGISFKEGVLILRPSSSSAKKKGTLDDIKVKVEVWPLPQITIKPLIVFSGDASISKLNLELWSAITIEDIKFDPPLVTFADELPYNLDIGESSLSVRNSVPQNTLSSVQQVMLALKVKGLQEPITSKFDLEIKKPALLQIQEFELATLAEYELMPDSEDNVNLTISNGGEDRLRINGVKLSPLGDQSGVAMQAEKEQLVIEPGKQAVVKFTIIADNQATGGLHWFEILFTSNDPVVEHNKRNFLIRIVDDKYPEFIAVDFGTTDSAIAVLDQVKMVPKNVPLEKGSTIPWIYSNIFFLNYDKGKTPPYDWCIGARARKLGPTRRDRFVKAIKTKAGTTHTEEITFREIAQSSKLTPEEIIEFIMKDLLQQIKIALGRRPARFILSVPTRFTLRKKEILRKTLYKAAKSLSLELDAVEIIDESLAAGLFYLLIRGAHDEFVKNKQNYNLMLLDFGGGTTDVTVFKVKQNLGKDGQVKEIEEVEVIGAWGDATLGGEEITSDIARMLLEKFLERKVDAYKESAEIKKMEDEAEALKLAVSELLKHQKPDGSIDIDNIMTSANASLRDSLSYTQHFGARDLDSKEFREVLDFYASNNHKLKVFSNDFSPRFVEVAAQEIVDIFERKLKKLKTELQLLLTIIGEKVDVLLLAGRSSQFQTVEQVFKELADRIDYVRDAQNKLVLKECVSLGALFYSFHLYGRLNLKISGWNRVWTRLGQIGFKFGKGSNFEDIIKWGEQYPMESKPFNLVRANVQDGKLVLTINENLSLGEENKIESYGVFHYSLNGLTQPLYPCKLRINEEGEIKALCQIQNEWREMEFKI